MSFPEAQFLLTGAERMIAQAKAMLEIGEIGVADMFLKDAVREILLVKSCFTEPEEKDISDGAVPANPNPKSNDTIIEI